MNVAGDDDTRPVTRARRGFAGDDLRGLPREQIRKLCHGLLLAEGAAVDDFRSSAEMDEFAVTIPGLWHLHRVVVRIYHRPVRQDDADDASVFATATGALEALVVATHGIDAGDMAMAPGVTLVSADDFVDRITASPLATWDEHRPAIDASRLELMLRLANAALLDPVGIEWLPWLALNELPPALIDHPIEPEDLLERKAFRLLTATFRFEGIRFGERARGKRLPDAVIDWPDGSATSALLDCKAASSGYRMDSDHFLRFVNYWESLAPQLEENGRHLKYMIVLSSYFQGQDGARHPFWNRAEQLADKTGLQLAYVTASDVAWTAARLEEADVQLSARGQFDWHGLLSNGIVTAEHFEAALNEVLK